MGPCWHNAPYSREAIHWTAQIPILEPCEWDTWEAYTNRCVGVGSYVPKNWNETHQLLHPETFFCSGCNYPLRPVYDKSVNIVQSGEGSGTVTFICAPCRGEPVDESTVWMRSGIDWNCSECKREISICDDDTMIVQPSLEHRKITFMCGTCKGSLSA